ncbi:hypothetical protein NLI96_g4109 [Meripilus lineatus]|uniref:Uncharacterized protein n=1 Tax=Meripilus lineatus TaxID=2056292 RepID=A0AAD5V756_9APHY|nr:hypothetical protein NLI96_g4109 [Physisporinus lineatus]
MCCTVRLSSASSACVATYDFLLSATTEINADKTIGGVDFGSVSNTGKIAFIVAGSVFTLVALISLFGFVGAVLRKRRFVKAYSYLTWVVFFISMAASGFYFYAVFSGKNLFPGCQFTDNNGVTRDCTLSLPLGQKIGTVVAVVIQLLIQLYIAVVIRRYVDQLEEERDYKHQYKLAKHSGQNSSTYTPSYYPPTAQDSHQGLLHNTAGAYPYSDASHSFGRTNA